MKPERRASQSKTPAPSLCTSVALIKRNNAPRAKFLNRPLRRGLGCRLQRWNPRYNRSLGTIGLCSQVFFDDHYAAYVAVIFAIPGDSVERGDVLTVIYSRRFQCRANRCRSWRISVVRVELLKPTASQYGKMKDGHNDGGPATHLT
jgi:hypothetical protein